ncbi:hypothetical protein GCM10010174_48630 [Kutzneria viridogrisea]
MLLICASLAVLTAGCGSELGPAQRPAVKVGAELPDLQVKLRALQADQCQSVTAETVYPECDRFVTEVVNLSAAIKAATEKSTRATDIATAVDKLASAGGDYQRGQCGAKGASPDTQVCARDLGTVRDQLIVLSSAMEQVAGH